LGTNSRLKSRPSAMASRCMKRLAYWVIVCVMFGSLSYGQSIFATLTGVVSDPSGAVVPNAKVHLRNESTGSLRDTVTNTDGYFTFASLAVGDFTHELTVEAQGFVTYKASGIALGGGEKRNINVTLKVGATTETVEIKAGVEQLATVDSGEKSATLGNKELQNYVQIGINAAEYIKIMPGFALNNATSNKANYDGQVIGINGNGDVEAYLARGYKGMLCYVESNNFTSLKSCYRTGYTDFGNLYVARLFNRYFNSLRYGM